jgi:hypothetical protein
VRLCLPNLLASLSWISARVYLQIQSIRASPQTYAAPVLTELNRFKPLTQWLYTQDLLYAHRSIADKAKY